MTSVNTSDVNRIHGATESADAFRQTVLTHWLLPCVIDPATEHVLSYSQVFIRAQSLAEALREMGLRSGDYLVLHLDNCLELLLLYIAAFLEGIVVVPIDPLKGKEETYAILNSVPYARLIASTPLPYERLLPLSTLVSLSEKQTAHRFDMDRLHSIDMQCLYLLTFTSGSTGVPKGVKHSLQNLLWNAWRFSQLFHFSAENVFLHVLPMTYMAGILNSLFIPLISGSRIVLGERFSVRQALTFWDIPSRYGVNTFWLVPAILSMVSTVDRGMTGSGYTREVASLACVGTAPLPKQLKQSFEARYQIPLYESYGLSETLIISSNAPKDDAAGTVGTLLTDTQITTATDGELLIDVPWMFLGYSNVDTASFFDGSAYRSGDLGTVIDGRLTITGRKKDLIIRGGMNISPKVVEDYLLGKNVFEECVVMGMKDQTMGEKIVCFFIPRGKFTKVKQRQVATAVISDLGQAFRIDDFFAVGVWPRHTNGKVDKLALGRLYAERER